MKDVKSAPFMVEMIRTATNMYAHGWDERNGGNISLLLSEDEISDYLDALPSNQYAGNDLRAYFG